MQDLSSEIKLLDEFFYVMEDQYPRKYKAWQTLKSAVSVQTANNTARQEILLCGLTGVKCGNRVRVCKLEFGKCNGQRKTSAVA